MALVIFFNFLNYQFANFFNFKNLKSKAVKGRWCQLCADYLPNCYRCDNYTSCNFC